MRQATPTLTIPDAAFTFSHLPAGGGSWVGGTGGPGEIEKVTVNYTWTFMTPLIRPFFPGGKLNMQVESSMKNEEVQYDIGPSTASAAPSRTRAARASSSSRSCCRSSWCSCSASPSWATRCSIRTSSRS